jgi:hypothetical protein
MSALLSKVSVPRAQAGAGRARPAPTTSLVAAARSIRTPATASASRGGHARCGALAARARYCGTGAATLRSATPHGRHVRCVAVCVLTVAATNQVRLPSRLDRASSWCMETPPTAARHTTRQYRQTSPNPRLRRPDDAAHRLSTVW